MKCGVGGGAIHKKKKNNGIRKGRWGRREHDMGVGDPPQTDENIYRSSYVRCVSVRPHLHSNFFGLYSLIGFLNK